VKPRSKKPKSAKCVSLRAMPGAVRVDAKAGIIYGATVATATEAVGHGFSLDYTSLKQIVQAINAAGELPVRCVHPDDNEDPLPRLCGSIRNARLDGQSARADVHLLSSARDREFLLEVASKMPANIALSIEFKPDYVETQSGRVARIKSLSAVDFVGIGAVTPNGLLSRKLKMDESKLVELRAVLGLPETATIEDILAAIQALQDGVNGDEETLSAVGTDTVALVRTAVESERLRAGQIRGLCKAMHLPTETADELIDKGATFDAAKRVVLSRRQELDSMTTPMSAGRITGGAPAADNKAVLDAATLLHLGRTKLAEKAHKPEIIQAARRLGIRNAEDLCRESVRLSGKADTTGRTSSEIVRLAFSSMALPETLGGSLDRVMAEAYAMEPQTWRSWCGVKTAKSFRTHKALRPYMSNSDFQAVGPNGEITHGSLEEEWYEFSIETKARMLSLTRQSIIDDSLNMLGDLASELARQAARAVNDSLYTRMLAGIGSFFVSGNGNYLSGAGSVLTVAGLSAAISNLRKRRDADNRILALVPKVLVVSPELEAYALQLVNSTTISRIADEDQLPEGNPFQGRLTVEVEPRLSDDSFHANASDTHWLLACGPENPTLVVAFLDGKETPTIETAEADFNQLGVQMRAYLDFGTGNADHRSAVLCAGA